MSLSLRLDWWLNVLLIVFDLLTTSNWVYPLCRIMLGWLSSVVYLTQRFQQFSPEIFLHILRGFVYLGFQFNTAAFLLVFHRLCGFFLTKITGDIHSSPSPVCIPGLRLAHLMLQMLHHQGHHIWSEATEWGSKSRSRFERPSCSLSFRL